MKRLVSILLAAAFAAPPALAEDLPGVEASKQIVRPLPEPIDDKPTDAKEAIRVGDWDVKVSGSITIDVGVGNLRKPPR